MTRFNYIFSKIFVGFDEIYLMTVTIQILLKQTFGKHLK